MSDAIIEQVREQMAALNQFQTDVKAELATIRDRSDKALQAATFFGNRQHQGSDGAPVTRGLNIGASQELKTWLSQPKGRKAAVTLELPFTAPSGMITKAAITGLSPVAPIPGIRGPAEPSLRLAELLPVIETASGAVSYCRETVFTSNAANVPEGTLKPETTVNFENVSVVIPTIAHFVKASLQSLNDTPTLMDWLSARLTWGVLAKFESNAITDPTNGLLALASALTPDYTPGAGATGLDTIGAALSELEARGYSPSGVILSGPDAAKMRLLKADGSGEYIWARPSGSVGTSRVWAVPAIIAPSMPVGSFVAADFAAAAALFQRLSMTIDVAYENEDDFIRNLACVRGEARMLCAVLDAKGLIKGTLPSGE